MGLSCKFSLKPIHWDVKTRMVQPKGTYDLNFHDEFLHIHVNVEGTLWQKKMLC